MAKKHLFGYILQLFAQRFILDCNPWIFDTIPLVFEGFEVDIIE